MPLVDCPETVLLDVEILVGKIDVETFVVISFDIDNCPLVIETVKGLIDEVIVVDCSKENETVIVEGVTDE